MGDVVDFHLGYTPFAVNYFDAYHVVEDGVVTDIWPILPRGPHGPWAAGDARSRSLSPDAGRGHRTTHWVDRWPARDIVVATYWVGVTPGGDIGTRCVRWRARPSTGTWVTLPGETARIQERHARSGAVDPAG